jgi:FtsP/CotA-like multicopper oxidase with cupredoxin domain
MKIMTRGLIATAFAMLLVPFGVSAQDSSIYVQCPEGTILHPDTDGLPGEPGIVCDHLSAGDGMVTMADDQSKQLYIFGFSRLALPSDIDTDPSNAATPSQASGGYPGWVMDNGTLAANAPAATIAVDEDDEVFLSLTNVGMAMRPDLFDPHTVHWHGFPNASSVFDGVPDASISIAGGATLTYYYNAKDAGTYMYHCHVEATEHMQMGMLGNLFVRPRQNRCPITDTTDPGFGLPGSDCPPGHTAGDTYAYNDGDGSTRYDVDVPIQIGSFDPDFHDASFGVQPLPFAAMRDRYFLLNGRGYPDTTLDKDHPISTVDPLGRTQVSQPVTSLIEAAPGQRILLRISNLNVTTFSTLGTSGLPMQVIALDARLLRDDDGNNMYYMTNSVTLGGGSSADVIITAPATAGTYFLYSKNLDQLSNDAENFGGMMTEIRVN